MSDGLRQARHPPTAGSGERAYTVVELLIIIALLGILTTLAVPELLRSIQTVKMQRAIADLRRIDFDIRRFFDLNESWPESLEDISLDQIRDPWGARYVYLLHQGPGWRGSARKDRFLVPLNRDYDLFSMGPDGESRPPLAVPVSHDDVVRAADGLFFGIARDF
jgi:general secretion pathway protein G